MTFRFLSLLRYRLLRFLHRFHSLFHFALLLLHIPYLLTVPIFFLFQLILYFFSLTSLSMLIKLCPAKAVVGVSFSPILRCADKGVRKGLILILLFGHFVQFVSLLLNFRLNIFQPMDRLRISEVVLPVNVGGYPLLVRRSDRWLLVLQRVRRHGVVEVILVREGSIGLLRTLSGVYRHSSATSIKFINLLPIQITTPTQTLITQHTKDKRQHHFHN